MKAALRRHRRILGETAWVFFGQGMSALATLVGLRLITEFVSPDVYGTVALALGVVALAHGLAAGPLMQAVLRYHPEVASRGGEHGLRRAALRSLRKPVLTGAALLAAAAAALSVLEPGLRALALLSVLLFLAEVARSVEVTFLNAARRQRAMALLVVIDAWLRPIAAVVLIWAWGSHGAALLAGYLLGAGIALLGFRLATRARQQSGLDAPPERPPADLPQRLREYALPLAALPLIGWVSGQADRYLVGSLAGVAAAGIYSALYGLASKPFLMLASGVELAVRQPFYARVSAGDRRGAVRLLALWLGGVLGVSLLVCGLIALFHEPIARALLAAEYRAHSALMGWIAFGYVLLAGAQVVERVCYACHDTRGVLGIQAIGAALSVAIGAPLVWAYGIEGAAWAVPVYFGVQLLIAGLRARQVWASAAQAAAVEPRAALVGTPRT